MRNAGFGEGEEEDWAGVYASAAAGNEDVLPVTLGSDLNAWAD